MPERSNPWGRQRRFRLNKHLNRGTVAQAEFMAMQPKDAGVARPEDLQLAALPKAQFPKPMHLRHRAHNGFNPDRLAFRAIF